jgi:HEAT repeat protein
MIPEAFLQVVLAVEAVAAAACVAGVALHALWLWRRDRVDIERLLRGHAALAAVVLGEEGPASSRVADLRRLPRRVQATVVDQLAVSVTGEEGRRVARVATELGLVDRARRRCRSRWWWRRLRGAHELNVHGGGDEVLPALLADPHPAVRAQAIEWAGDAQNPDLAPRLVAALADPAALCRHTAADAILRAGASLVDVLAEELSASAGQQQADLLAVLARRPDTRYGPAAVVASAGELPALRAAAAALLGGVGGEDAGRALRGLLADSDAAVRAAAVDGLRRARIEDAVPDIAPLLGDEAHAVRRAAGAALASLGPGGTLLLRHYTASQDRYAADMARHALDVAALRRPGVVLD